MKEETFKSYIDAERAQFVKEISKYPVDQHLSLRTAVDDFLIAFDQLNQKLPMLLDCEKSGGEEVVLHYCAAEDIEVIRDETWTTEEVVKLMNDFIETVRVQNQNNNLVL